MGVVNNMGTKSKLRLLSINNSLSWMGIPIAGSQREVVVLARRNRNIPGTSETHINVSFGKGTAEIGPTNVTFLSLQEGKHREWGKKSTDIASEYNVTAAYASKDITMPACHKMITDVNKKTIPLLSDNILKYILFFYWSS